MHLPDRELVTCIRSHDAAAFEAFYARHREKVRRHLLRMLRQEEAAEDLVQETFLRVWTRADQWDGRGRMSRVVAAHCHQPGAELYSRTASSPGSSLRGAAGHAGG